MFHRFGQPPLYLFHMGNNRISTHFRKQLGVNVGTLREERGLTQAALALRANVDRSYVNKIENARVNPTIDKMVQLADGLGVPITALFHGLDQLPPSETVAYDYETIRVPR